MPPLAPAGEKRHPRLSRRYSGRPDKAGSWVLLLFYREKENDMNIKPFAVEEWMNEYEVGALYNIAET